MFDFIKLNNIKLKKCYFRSGRKNQKNVRPNLRYNDDWSDENDNSKQGKIFDLYQFCFSNIFNFKKSSLLLLL